MIIINVIQVLLIGLWTLIFVYIIIPFLPAKLALWLTVYLWSPLTAFFTGSPIKTYGREKLDPHKNYIFMANHASYYDIPCLFLSTRRKLHFLAKAELKESVFAGFAIKKLQMVFIERGNAQKTAVSIRHVEEMIKSGYDIAIFPEGTRTKTGELGVFRKGGFKMAINANTDIVPITIKKSAIAWDRSNIRFRPTIVTVHIGDPIPVEQYTEDAAQSLVDKTRNTIQEELQKA